MIKTTLAAAAALTLIAGATAAQARSFNSDGDAAITESQKLGPNSYSRQVYGGVVVSRGHAGYRRLGYIPAAPGSAYVPSFRDDSAPAGAYGYEPGW